MKIKIGSFQWTSRSEHRRLVLLMGVALVAFIAGVSVLVGIVRLPAPRPQTTKNQPLNLTRLNAAESNKILNDEAYLLDPTPLFLPTPFNATHTDIAGIVHRDPAESFDNYGFQPTFSDTAFTIAFPDPVPIPAKPVDTLTFEHAQTPFATIGQSERPVSPLPARAGSVEVVDTKTGQAILRLPLAFPPKRTEASANISPSIIATDAPAIPDAVVAGDLWSPLEFLVAIDLTGMVGEPMLVQGTAAPAVVQFFANYLVKDLRLGNRHDVSAGFYILRVGP